MPKYPYAGIILAGGLNKRMAGKNKALLSVGDQPILGRQIGLFQELFEQVIVVTNRLLDYTDRAVTLVSDLLPVRSSLTGIHAGLFYAKPSHAFISACDMPFLKTEMVDLICQSFEARWDIVVPQTREGYQPLCALYGKRCLKPIEDLLNQGDLKISKLFSKVKIKKIPEVSLRQVDSDLISFFNINTAEDWSRSQEMINHE
jgi:molybdenum cofactor guanylyltransferase